MTSSSKTFVPDPNRFNASKATLYIDQFMNHFIKVGGIGIIVIVFGIFAFILWQIWPLFQPPSIQHSKTIELSPGEDYLFMGQDEYYEYPFFVKKNGDIVFYDFLKQREKRTEKVTFDHGDTLSASGEEADSSSTTPYLTEPKFTAVNYNYRNENVLYGTEDGRFAAMKVAYTPNYNEKNERQMVADLEPLGSYLPLGKPGSPIIKVAYGDKDSGKIAAAIQNVNGRREVHAIYIEQQTTIFGAGESKVVGSYDFTSQIVGTPQFILCNRTADGVTVGTEEGEVFYFFRKEDKFELRQRFPVFESGSTSRLTLMTYLFGDTSIVFGGSGGENIIYSLYIPHGENTRTWHQTKKFPNFEKSPTLYAPSMRNKGFLIADSKEVSVRFATTEEIRLSQPFQDAKLVSLGLRYDYVGVLDLQNRLHLYKYYDPHPNASFKSMFGKIWYEGSPEPKYEWQSTGGSDDFEAKLSLIPLIIGTLKGTFYAMLFAVPISLFAALYVSQFCHPTIRQITKPTMEIMASLPSVVLGFLAALWLAPLIEERVPSILLILIFVPTLAFIAGYAWDQLPVRVRTWVQNGHEWWVFAPLLFLAMWSGWVLGPVLESIFFVVTDNDTGMSIADFRRWWPETFGLDYQQRNSLVVGFVMGFAVIPIIFTITEDSLSNVPGAMKSGSLALGASRWQTAIRIVLPTASAGIFSALMIGLGRAVGETMIVVMATGNTPIMEWNIFSGMRTLSANIAVELPEAAVGGTLYRSLFLGAMVLFLMTFLVNTLAEILRQHLREKYKTV